MDIKTGVGAHNWFGDIRFSPSVIVRPTSEAELVAIVKDRDQYPSPVRASGSTHSTTRCVVADTGTVVDMRAMNRIIQIRDNTVTAQAGALYIDVAQELEKHNLQFDVNIELGNLSMGAAACTHTKDASFPSEFGIVSSYAIGMKAVLPSGDILVVTEEQPELLQAMRTSFGLLGLVFEVTFRVKPLKPMAVYHENFRLDDFLRRLPELRGRGESMMYYLFPFHDRICVEFRRMVDVGQPAASRAYRLRNLGWGTVAPGFAATVRKTIPVPAVRDALYGGFDVATRALMAVMKDTNAYPADQMIRYPEKAGGAKYTFSIWAFPVEVFPRAAPAYFAFCKDYYRSRGYRCNMVNVGYHINQDKSSLFSYTYNGTAMTLDPVSTGGPGWPEFLDAYNAFCSHHGGSPLFNQTARLTRQQVAKAFAERLEQFRVLQAHHDPDRRFVNEYFAELIGRPAAT